MSETTNAFNRCYNRIQSVLTTIPQNLRSIDISWIRLRRGDASSSSSVHSSQTRPDSSVRPLDDCRPRTESSHSLFASGDSSQTQSPARSATSGGPTAALSAGQQVCRPPHSHLYRHSSHYPLLFGAYNNWSLSRDNRLITNYNNINVEKERNVLSAILSIIVIATLATALAQPKWFSITGGVCTRKYIGLQEFFYVSNFNNYHLNGNSNKAKLGAVVHKTEEADTKDLIRGQLSATDKILFYGLSGDLKNCVTPEIVTLQRTIIGLCFFAIMFNLIQFFFDTLGVHKKWLNAIRAHALGNILAVLLCVVIVGLSYLVSTLLEREQRRLVKERPNPTPDSAHIEVKFELSYYLVTFSGLLAIIAAASNLLRRPQHYSIDPSDAFWTEDIDDELTSSATASPDWQPFNASRALSLTIPNPGVPPHPSAALPPPPPYSP